MHLLVAVSLAPVILAGSDTYRYLLRGIKLTVINPQLFKKDRVLVPYPCDYKRPMG